MQFESRFLDDLTKVAGGALGAVTGVRDEVEGMIRQQFEKILAEMDVVPREEFEAVKATAQAARMEQEKLETRVAALEKALSERTPPEKTPPEKTPPEQKASKAAAKKTTAAKQQAKPAEATRKE